MDKKEFKKLLEVVGIRSMTNFAELTGEKYETVKGWGRNIKSQDGSIRTNPIPNWVESWLENYQNSEKFKIIKEVVKGKVD